MTELDREDTAVLERPLEPSMPPALKPLELEDEADSQATLSDQKEDPADKKSGAAPKSFFVSGLFRKGLVASLLWCVFAATYLLSAIALGQSIAATPTAIGGLIAGFLMPLALIWLLVSVVQRGIETDYVVQPLRRQLNALLAPGAAYDARMRRAAQLLAAQTKRLKEAAEISIDDASSAMTALSKQSAELRRISAEAMLEIGVVTKNAEKTLKMLEENLGKMNVESSGSTGRFAEVTTLYEKKIKDLSAQVESLAASYEARLEKLSSVSTELENKSKSLLSAKLDLSHDLEDTAASLASDLNRLEDLLSEVSQRSASISHQLVRPVESLETAATKLDDTMKETHKRLTESTDLLSGIGDTTIARASGLVETLSDRLSSLELMGAKMVSAESAVRSDTSKLLSSVSDMKQTLIDNSAKTAEVLTSALEQTAQITTASTEKTEALSAALSENAHRISTATEASQSLVRELQTTNGSLALEIDRLTARHSDLMAQIDKADYVGALLSDLGSTLQTRTANLQDATQHSVSALESATAKIEIATQNSQESTAELETRVQALSQTGDTLRREMASLAQEAESKTDMLDHMRATLERSMVALSDLATREGSKIQTSASALETQIKSLDDIASQTYTASGAALDAMDSLHEKSSSVTSALEAAHSTVLAEVEKAEEAQSALATIAKSSSASLENLHTRIADDLSMLTSQLERLSAQTDVAGQDLSKQASAAILTEETLARLQIKAQEATQMLHLEKQALDKALAEISQKSEQTVQNVTRTAATLSQEMALFDSAHAKAENLATLTDSTSLKVQNLSENVASFESTLQVLHHESDMLGTSLSKHAAEASLAVSRTQQAAGQMDTILGNLTSQMQAFARVSQEEQEQLQDWLKELVAATTSLDQAGNTARTHLQAAQEQLAQNETTLLVGGTKAKQVLAEATEQMEEAALALAQQAQASAHALRASSSSVTDAHTLARTETEQTHTTLLRLNSDMQDLTRLMDALSARSDDLSSKLSGHTNATIEAGTRVQGAVQIVADASEKLEGKMSSLIALSLREAGTLSEQVEQLQAAETKLVQNTEQSQVALQDTLDRLATTTLQAGELLEAARDKLATASTTLTDASAQGQLGYGSLAGEMARLSASITTQVDEARASLAAAEAQFSSMGSTLSTQTSEMDEQLLALVNRTSETQTALEKSATTLLGMGESVSALLGDMGSRMASLESYSQTITNQAEALETAGRAMSLQKDQALQSMSDVQHQLDDITSSLSLLTSAVLSANEAGSESRMGADLLASQASSLTAQLQTLTTALETRQSQLNAAAEETVSRLILVEDELKSKVDLAAYAQDQLMTRAEQSQHVMSGLTELATMSSGMVDEATLKMAAMAGSVASENARLEALAETFAAQEMQVKEAAQAAAAMLRLAEEQMRTSSTASRDALAQVQSGMVDSAQILEARLKALSEQTSSTLETLDQASHKLANSSSDLMDVGQQVSADMLLNSDKLGSSVQTLASAGLQLDRDMKLRLENIATTEAAISATLARCGGELTTLDSAMRTCLEHLGHKGEELRAKLALEIGQFHALPTLFTQARDMLGTQMESARAELLALKQNLLGTSQTIAGDLSSLTEIGLPLSQTLRQIREESQMTAEQIRLTAADITESTQEAATLLRTSIRAGLSELAVVKDEMNRSEGHALSTVVAARQQIEALAGRIEHLSGIVSSTAATTELRYVSVTEQSRALIEDLSGKMDVGAERLAQATEITRQGLTEAISLVSIQEQTLVAQAKNLVSELMGIRGQLTGFGTTLSGLDERLGTVAPTLEIQQGHLEQFLSAIDRTMSKVNHLEEKAEDLASAHLGIAKELAAEENKLLNLTHTLSARMSDFRSGDTEALALQLQQILAHVEGVQSRMLSLSDQAGKLDQAISTVRDAIGEETEMLEAAENRLGIAAELTGNKLRKATENLNDTIGQVEKTAHMSQLSLGQTGEETQRLVVRLEQVRAMVKTMMSSVSTDLTSWQSDIRTQLQDIGAKIKTQADTKPKSALAPITTSEGVLTSPAAMTRGAPETSGTTPFFTQLADEALHALAVDLYRVLHSEVPHLRHDLPDTGRGKSPMTPHEARAHTERLISNDSRSMRESMRELYLRNPEFRSHADRYLTRFELQYDVLARHKDNLDAATKWREGPHGQLYRLLSQAIERRSKLASHSEEVL